VIASASTYAASDSSEVPEGVRTGSIADGYAEAWGRIQEAGTELTVIVDTPRPGIDVPECIAENENNLTECAVDRSDAVASSGSQPMQEAAATVGVDTVDMADVLCSPESCAPVVGGVIVWRDSHHITATYAETLAGSLERQFRDSSSLEFQD